MSLQMSPLLLQAARDEPEDDTPRLVLADWLEEHGDEAERARAELIRIQLEQARLPADHPDQRDLRTRSRVLQEQDSKSIPSGFEPCFRPPGYTDPVSPSGAVTMEESLLAQIADQPEDDAPRLVLADWLMDQPDPAQAARGELIQIQCRLARLPADDPGPAELRQRQRELIERHRSSWLGPLVELWHTFDRGLVKLMVNEKSQGMRWLEDHPRNRWIDNLSLVRAGGGEIERLASVRYLSSLTTLKVFGSASASDTERAGLVALSRSPNLARVRILEVMLQPGLVGLQALAESPHLGRLTHLGLSLSRMGPEGARVLARFPGLGRLEQLNLSGAELGVAGLETLLSSASRGALRGLDMTNDHLDGALAGVLNAWSGLPGLRRLELRHNPLGSRGVVSLLQGLRFDAIRELGLGSTGLTSRGLVALANWPGLAFLDRLGLEGNRMGLEGVRTLLAAPQPPALVDLDLSNNNLGPRAVELLCREAPLHRLERLCLNENTLRDAGARILAGCPSLERLRILHLRETGLSDAGVRALLDSPGLAGVQLLDIDENGLEEETEARMRQRFSYWGR
jgi:uncharacterized protein (TIGR02996 family)